MKPEPESRTNIECPMCGGDGGYYTDALPALAAFVEASAAACKSTLTDGAAVARLLAAYREWQGD